MTTTVTEARGIAEVDHDEAMSLAETEYGRLLDVVGGLDDSDWSSPTDCELWDVRDMLSHVLGGMERDASMRVALRERRLASRASKRSGRPYADEMTALQVRERAGLEPADVAGVCAGGRPGHSLVAGGCREWCGRCAFVRVHRSRARGRWDTWST